MILGWLESLMLGITTGLTNVLPVSAQAHNRILIKFMGKGNIPALLMLFMHLGVLAALPAPYSQNDPGKENFQDPKEKKKTSS